MGSRQGYGIYRFPSFAKDGDTSLGIEEYAGYWFNNMIDGEGCYKWSDGSKYEGHYKLGKRHGQGTMYYGNNFSYSGFYKDDKMHGKGIMSYTDGKMIKGTWVNGKLHGHTLVLQPDGTEKHEVYENGKLIKRSFMPDTISESIVSFDDRQTANIYDDKTMKRKTILTQSADGQ